MKTALKSLAFLFMAATSWSFGGLSNSVITNTVLPNSIVPIGSTLTVNGYLVVNGSHTVVGGLTVNTTLTGAGVSQQFVPGVTLNYTVLVTSNAYMSGIVGNCLNTDTLAPVTINGVVGHVICFFATASDLGTSQNIIHSIEGRGVFRGSASNYSTLLLNPTHLSIVGSSTTLMQLEGRTEMYKADGTTPSSSSDTFVTWMQYPEIGSPQVGKGWAEVLDSTYPVGMRGQLLLDNAIPVYAPHSQITTWPTVPSGILTIHGRSTANGELNMFSDSAVAFLAVELGRTGIDGLVSIPAAANQFLQKDLAGDLDIQNANINGTVNLGVGGIAAGVSGLQVYRSSTVVNSDTLVNTGKATFNVIPSSAITYAVGVSTTAGGPWIIDVSTSGHLNAQANTPPTFAACGTSPAISANGNDIHGTATLGSGGPLACSIIFAQPFNTAPDCFFQINSSTITVGAYGVSTTSATLATSLPAGGFKVKYFCMGND